MENFGSRNGKFEKNAVVKNQGTKQRGQNTPGDCWQWKANGQCFRGNNCSFRHDVECAKTTQPNAFPSFSTMREMHREPEVLEAKVPVEECVDCPGTCTNSFCEKWHPPECLFWESGNGCRSGEKCSYAHRQVGEQPSKSFKKEW